MLYIGYKYESSLGHEIKKLVLCKDEAEYRKMKQRIEGAGLEAIEFIEVYKAARII